MTKDQINSLMERLADKQYHPGDHLKTQPQVMPVRIGDVLEKIWINTKPLREGHIKLLFLWRKCGFTLSLQEIYQEKPTGWLELFTFLTELFNE